MLYYSNAGENVSLSSEDLREGLFEALTALGQREKVLAIPPDITRFYSRAGELTRYAHQYYDDRMTDILPALGTHFAMTEAEIKRMFGDVPLEKFRVHNWRDDLATLGEVPGEFVKEVSGGKVDFAWPAQVNRLLVCLLYTSPSPRDRQKSRMPSSA